MPVFSKSSLEILRQRIDLVEVLSPYVNFTKSGASYKGLCPFHEEKTPSFVIRKGDTHYHCYGCGAHGDAISFLMVNQKLSFFEAVESLADRFQVHLEVIDKKEKKGPNKSFLKEALDKAARFYQFYLLKTKEGLQALKYLYERGITLEFIKKFKIGLAPQNGEIFQKVMTNWGVDKKNLEVCGLIKINFAGKSVDFFQDRIMIPIFDNLGSYVGFTARKYKNNSYGPKYINSPDTLLFKKSKILFGFNFARRQIAKEKSAILVEGQIDALRMLYLGFDKTVALQGTACTEEHVSEFENLGVNKVFIAFDSDLAGQEACIKAGNLFQKHAIDVFVINLDQGSDPDTILIQKGPCYLKKLIEKKEDFLSFLVRFYSKKFDVNSPAGKNELIQTIVKHIKSYQQPLMVHECIKKLSILTSTPENLLNVDDDEIYIKKNGQTCF